MSVKEQYPVSPVVTLVNHQTVTTSLNVAGVFRKEHKHVLEAIGNLDVPEEFGRSNFRPSSYFNAQGKEQPMFNLTRDGFTLLAMGFTGPKAIKFKLAYIEAFGQMEAELRQRDAQDSLGGSADPVRLAVQMMPIFLQMIQGATNRIEKQGETVEKVVKEQGEASATRDTIIQQKGEDLSEQMLEIRGEVDEVADATDSLLLHTSAIMTQNQETSLMIGELQGQIEAGMNRFKDIIQAPILKALADHRAHFDTLMGMQNAMFDHMSAQMTMIKHKAECAMNGEKRDGMLAYLHQNLPGTPLEPMVTSIHDNSNSVEKFMDTCLEKSEGGKLQYGLLHKVYKAWCYEHNALPLGRDTAWIKFQQVLIKRNMKGFCMKPYRALEDVRFKEGALQPL